MPNVAVCNISSAGGTIRPTQTQVRWNGQPVAVVGCPVDGHGQTPHNNPRMVQGSGVMRINGVPVCLAGHKASCDHQANGVPGFTVFA